MHYTSDSTLTFFMNSLFHIFLSLCCGDMEFMYVSPIIECSMLSTYTPSFINILTREYSLLGEVSLYGRSPVLQVYIQLLHYIQITYKSSLVKLETSCAVILPPTMCVLCPYSIRIIDQYVLLTLKSFQFLAIYLLFISSFRDALN